MAKKKTTIHDIAKKLDTTASTVSRALRDHPRISKSTKKAVWKMAKKLDYQPNNIAAALRKGKSNIIGVLVPTSDRHFFASVIRGIEEGINKAGYNIIICQSDDLPSKEQSNIEALLKIQVDGIIASIAKDTTDFSHYERIIKRGTPLILYDRVREDLQVNTVTSNDYLGAFKAVEHLIEQGCTNIAHFSGQQHVMIYQERLRGYKDALKKHQLPINEKWILEADLIDETATVLQTGRRLTQQLLEMDNLPDGIFSSNDFAAMGAIQVLKEQNIAIPEEVALVGFSNDISTSFIEPALSTVDQFTKQMGNFAAQLFLEQVNTDDETPYTPRKTVLNPELIVRASSLRR